MTAAQAAAVRPVFVAWRVGRTWSRWHLLRDDNVHTACGLSTHDAAGFSRRGFTMAAKVPGEACHSCVAAALTALDAARPTGDR